MSDPRNVVLLGDSREVLKTLADDSIDALVTDPPAGISFMGKDFDSPDTYEQDEVGDRAKFIAFLRGIMAESFRVLKPGAYGVVWAIPRTSHWTAMAIEDAGFEIRDCIYHVFGQGFPKSLNVSKAIDKRRADNSVIRPWLRSLGSREEIASASGVTPRQVDHWLGDNTPCPQTLTEERFRKLCQHFGDTPTWADQMYEQVGEILGEVTHSRSGGEDFAKRPGSTGTPRTVNVNAPATDDAKKWDGWGTSLKPAVECWWLVRKPIVQQNVAQQVLATGTGAINIGATRIGGEDTRRLQYTVNGFKQINCKLDGKDIPDAHPRVVGSPAGRWPSNLLLSHSPGCRKTGTATVRAPVINRFDDGMKPFGDGAGHPFTSSGGGTEEHPVYECEPGCPVAAMDQQSGVRRSAGDYPTSYSDGGGFTNGDIGKGVQGPLYDDKGGASRFFQTFEPQYDVPFFYTGKASKRDKNEGLEDMPERAQHEMAEQTSSTQSNRRCRQCNRVKFGQPHCECVTPDWEETVGSKSANHHPTVKSQDLMQYLVRLVTPPGGIVLDPFAGSGSTLVAAITEGMQFIGIEREDEYVKIAQRRVDAALKRTKAKKFGEDLFELAMSMGDD